jgi:hypothetical protein
MIRPSGPIRARLTVLCAALLAATTVHATTLRTEASLVDLLKQSDLILHGRVVSVTDGLDGRGIPYTEVTLSVSEALKGKAGDTYTFRQFGLLKPRRMPDGRVNLMVTPAAWPTYTAGEETILFLNRPAAWTGLQTTAGLGQGKFKVSLAGAVNQANNTSLFRDVQVDDSLLDATEERVMATQKGAVNAHSFTTLVKRAVDGRWVENGRMRHARR